MHPCVVLSDFKVIKNNNNQIVCIIKCLLHTVLKTVGSLEIEKESWNMDFKNKLATVWITVVEGVEIEEGLEYEISCNV